MIDTIEQIDQSAGQPDDLAESRAIWWLYLAGAIGRVDALARIAAEARERNRRRGPVVLPPPGVANG